MQEVGGLITYAIDSDVLIRFFQITGKMRCNSTMVFAIFTTLLP